jgi:hypothetical protein
MSDLSLHYRPNVFWVWMSAVPSCDRHELYINIIYESCSYIRLGVTIARKVLPFCQHELNANVYTSRQFSKGKFTFNPMASFSRFIIASMASLHQG